MLAKLTCSKTKAISGCTISCIDAQQLTQGPSVAELSHQPKLVKLGPMPTRVLHGSSSKQQQYQASAFSTAERKVTCTFKVPIAQQACSC